MTSKELITGIKTDSASVWRRLFSSPARTMSQQLGPILKDVRDVTFDDVFEEACIVLMENVKAGKLDEGETNLEGYLYVLCKRIALRYAGKKRALSMDSGKMVIQDAAAEQLPGTPEEEQDDDARVAAFLDRVLEAMPAHQRAVLRYFYWDKMSMSEIAALCGFKNENVAKSTKKRYMEKFKAMAAKMLKDDQMAEAAIGRTVERAAIREQLEECRQMGSGVLVASSIKEGKSMLGENEIIVGIRENSPVAWKALYASIYDKLKKELDSLFAFMPD